MNPILSIETSGNICSVAVHNDGSLLGIHEFALQKSHSRLLNVSIEQLLKSLDISLKDLSAIAVSKGPGSYTGLRIGVSTAKGLCYGLDLPLISVNTLHALALQYSSFNFLNAHICPMLDARRMEVYSCLFAPDLSIVNETTAIVLTENTFVDILAKYKVAFIGDGANKFRNLINNPNAYFGINISVSAKQIGEIASAKFLKNEFEDVAYFEPYYLKDFVSTSTLKK
ncbi:MAG: tRNA (adenosine(37)-N6)-threonylcarbamoyltransferase complex dimerization subunit type 1 TsaB [Cytophagaceae bacterium]